MQPPSPVKLDPLVNSVLLGTYRIDRLLGKGGMGSVYAATHVHLQTQCAIKVLLHEFSGSDNSEALKRFQREAQITSQLGHPNIVRVTDFNFTPDGAPFMVMELLSGETLQRRLKQRGKLKLPEAVLMFGPLCDALGLAHERLVIHRDLKPENIFLPQDAGLDGAKILDFGISKIRDGNTKLTQADVQMGTQSYMAPEIVCGAAAEADVRSDVFSLGALLYEALTGKMAYDGPNAMAVMYKLMYQPAPSARAIDPDIPEAVDAVILRALAREPAERIQTAPQLFAELTEAAMPFLPAGDGMEAQVSTRYRFTSQTMNALRASGAMPQLGRPGARPPTGPQIGPLVVTPAQPGQPIDASARPPTGPRARQTPGATGGSGPQSLAALLAADGGGPKTSAALADQEGDGPSALPTGALQHAEIEDERPNRNKHKGGPLIMGVIIGLVVLTGAGLLILRNVMTSPAVGGPPTTTAGPVQPVVAPAKPAPDPVQHKTPLADKAADKSAAGTPPAAADGTKKATGDEQGDDDKGKHHHRHHRDHDQDQEQELPHLKLPTLPQDQ